MVAIGWSTCWGNCVWILLPWAPLITWSTLGGGSGQGESCKLVFFILGKFSHLQALGINWSSTTAVIECQRLSGWYDPVSVFSNILSRWHCGSFWIQWVLGSIPCIVFLRGKSGQAEGDGAKSCHTTTTGQATLIPHSQHDKGAAKYNVTWI